MTPQSKALDEVVVVEAPRGIIGAGAETDHLSATLQQLIRDGHKKILLDLARSSHMTSRTIGMLIGAQSAAFERGAALYLCNVDKHISNVLLILCLTRVLNVFGTRVEALNFLGQLDLELAADTMHVRAARVEKLNTVLAYLWANHHAAAAVHQGAGDATGRAVMRMRDAAGAEVFAYTLGEPGAFTSLAGKPGIWRVELDMTDYSGPLELGIVGL